MMRTVFRHEASLDLEDAYRWYERRADGLGDDFRQEIERTLASIRRFPQMHPVIRGEARRAPMGRFPYGIIYLVEQDAIVVVGVVHDRRDAWRWIEQM